jgi:uncharacterized protein YuzE
MRAALRRKEVYSLQETTIRTFNIAGQEIEIDIDPKAIIHSIELWKEGRMIGKIDGVGKDVEQIDGIAAIPYDFTGIDPKAMFAMAKVMAEGLKNHTRGGWRKVPLEKHLNNGLSHIYAYLAGDKQDEHLSHALCRIMFAVALEIEEKEKCQKNGQ